MSKKPPVRTKRQEITRRYYLKNKEKNFVAARVRTKDMQEWFKRVKSFLKCQTCDESHRPCLEFHHINPKDKDISVGNMMSRKYSKKRIIAEMQKCAVLCANCHRKVHSGAIVLDYAMPTAISLIPETELL